MGLATIDLHSQKVKSTPRFTRFPSLVLLRPLLTEIQRFENVKINKEMYGIRTLRRTLSDGQRPVDHTFLKF